MPACPTATITQCHFYQFHIWNGSSRISQIQKTTWELSNLNNLKIFFQVDFGSLNLEKNPPFVHVYADFPKIIQICREKWLKLFIQILFSVSFFFSFWYFAVYDDEIILNSFFFWFSGDIFVLYLDDNIRPFSSEMANQFYTDFWSFWIIHLIWKEIGLLCLYIFIFGIIYLWNDQEQVVRFVALKVNKMCAS